MKSQILIATLVSLNSIFAAAAPGLTESSSHNLPVSVKSGNCPRFAQITTSVRYYEGGGEYTVTARTLAFASPARLLSRSGRVAVFRAPLKPRFRTCRGVTVSSSNELSLYRFNFQNGSVTFRATVPKEAPNVPGEITQASVSKGRPLVKWIFSD